MSTEKNSSSEEKLSREISGGRAISINVERFLRLKLIMARNALTQKEFAKRIGKTSGYISDLRKRINMSTETLQKICETFGVNKDWLLEGIGPSGFKGLPYDDFDGGEFASRLSSHDQNAEPFPPGAGMKHTLMEFQARVRPRTAPFLENTILILESDTDYRPALEMNIQAFTMGVKAEKEKQIMIEQMERMTKAMAEMKADNKREYEELKSLILNQNLSATEHRQKKSATA